MTEAGSGATRDRGRDGLVLAVDLGTGGPKIGFVSVTGRVAWQDHVRLSTRWLDGGGAVQDAHEWWDVITGAVRKAIANATVPAGDVVAVCVTGQWASTVPVDAEGVPVGDCIMWQDHRGIRLVRRRIGGRVAGYSGRALAAWVRKTGGIPGGNDPVGHMLNLAANHPDVAAAARWYLEPVDYVAMRFTGVPAATHASMTAAWLTDNRRLDHLAYDADLVERAGVDGDKLPPLVPTGSVIGTVRDDVAADLGLPPGVQVVAGVPDLHAAAIGSGALGEGQAHMALSTTSWISLPVPRKRTDVSHGMASIPGLDGGYLLANNHDTSGLCLQWLRDNVLAAGDGLFGGDGGDGGDGGEGDGGDEGGGEGTECSFDDLTALAATSPPGARRVVFTPWLAGERTPVSDSHLRGGFHNLSLATTRADLVRAVMEGVAYNNHWLHGYVERFAKQTLDPIRVVGGGAQSDLWCQIHADVMDRTIERVDDPLHAQLRGAAMLAGMSLGLIDRAEVRDLVTVSRTFTPDPARRDVYDRLSAELPRLCSSQRKMFRRLNRRWS
ncbi:MAG TPA: FGGY-family carbohydrate kinase [Acidimicrobiales bacterium]|nr:FGGY-family carbohydrate kinase [Acidimicrobiales bacterium]